MKDIIAICEICSANVGIVTPDASKPLAGRHFKSLDPHHGWPAPFRSNQIEWEYFACPSCGFKISIKENTILTNIGMLTAVKTGMVDGKGKFILGKDTETKAPPIKVTPVNTKAPKKAVKAKTIPKKAAPAPKKAILIKTKSK